MLSKADEDQLQRVCGNDETLAEARKLVPLAKTRTKQGSGHYLSGLTTALPAICAYIASKRLNNNDVVMDNARQSSCLNTSDFTKALRIVSTVLEAELSPRKGKRTVTYDILHEKYNIEMPYSNFSMFLQQAESALVQLDTRYKIESSEVRCAIFFWASSVIKASQLPTLDEFTQDNALLSKRLMPVIKLLNDKCNSLKAKLTEAAKDPSRPSSPTKFLLQPTTPRTPRRTPNKPLRELPTRDSVRKQRQISDAEISPTKGGDDINLQDIEMTPPETPTKKRKLETSSPVPSTSKRRLLFPATPSAPHIAHITSPIKSKPHATPAIPSPLRRSARFVLQEEVDAEMDGDDDAIDEGVNRSLEVDLAKVGEEKDEEEEPVSLRRFRPVYQDLKQWYARDARVSRMWKEADERDSNKLEVFE